MKKLIVTALCASVSCYGIDNIFERSINIFTRDVYYRYYLIQRCEEPVMLLINNPSIWKTIDLHHLDVAFLENDIVIEKATVIQKTHIIQPFLDLWHQIKSHRHVDDASFHKNFVMFLFMLYKSLEQPSSQKATAPPPASYSIEKMLSSIDKHIDKIRPSKLNNHKSDSALHELHPVSTDDIALNYYLIQRLDKPIKLLSTMHEDITSSNGGWLDHAMCNIGVNFSHERINYCFNQMATRKNLEPFLHTWQEFRRFRHVGDTHFLKEMLMMLFAVYKDLLFAKLTEESEEFITSEINTILDLYEHVNELPLDDILHAIDLTTDKLLLLQSLDKKAKQSWGQQYPLLFHTLLALPVAYFIIKTCTV
jgi:hypothetical protein